MVPILGQYGQGTGKSYQRAVVNDTYTHKKAMTTGVPKQSAPVLTKHNTIYFICCGFSCVEGGSGALCWPRLGCNRNGREAKCGILYSLALRRPFDNLPVHGHY
jgi:hypothetical protein